MNFLKTDDAQEIIFLDKLGYPLALTQKDLTYPQRLFIAKGRTELEKKIQEAERKEIKKSRKR